MSIERSRKDSSREETVSHVRHRVSLVRTPSNSLCTIVDDGGLDPVEAGSDIRELETEKHVFSLKAALDARKERSQLTIRFQCTPALLLDFLNDPVE